MEDSLAQARAFFLDSVQLFEAGRFAEAEQRLEAALALVPGRPSVLVNLGATRLQLGKDTEALAALDAALAAEPAHVDALCHRGTALSALGRDDEAVASFDRALAIDPGQPAALYCRAFSLNRLGRHADALATLDALLADHGDLARAWLLHGQTLQSLERPEAAVASYRRAVAIAPELGEAWGLLGQLHKDQGRLAEARAAFEQAVAHGADTDINRYFLAALTGQAAPAATPHAYVRGLFDPYAGDFESHLVEVLRYHAPQAMVQAVRALGRTGFGTALDLGCGTGLCGPLLQPIATRIDGVDLSPTMLQRAAERKVYDALAEADVAEHLHGTAQRYGLVVSTDVFIYIGDLTQVFAGVARVLQTGGVFAFSVEALDDGRDFALRPSLRYAHAEPYLRTLAQAHGFEVLSLQRAPLREEQRQPIEGFIVCMGKG